ncbi:hypothetical protein F5X99DRAFT_391151 [Biscogniauxia marginata]|nr:hypothetical protein F5X99DRAFT_391151 [Biscogniauxia marginata]
MLSRTWPLAMRAFAPTPILNGKKDFQPLRRTRTRNAIMMIGTGLGHCQETLDTLRRRLNRTNVPRFPPQTWLDTHIARMEADIRTIQDCQIYVREIRARNLFFFATATILKPYSVDLRPKLGYDPWPEIERLYWDMTNKPIEEPGEMANLTKLFLQIEKVREVNSAMWPLEKKKIERRKRAGLHIFPAVQNREAQLVRAGTLVLQAAALCADRGLGNFIRNGVNLETYVTRKIKGFQNRLDAERRKEGEKEGKTEEDFEPEEEEVTAETRQAEIRKARKERKRKEKEERQAKKRAMKERTQMRQEERQERIRRAKETIYKDILRVYG